MPSAPILICQHWDYTSALLICQHLLLSGALEICITAAFWGKVMADDATREVTCLRRILAVFLCLCMLCIPVQAAESEKLVVLSFDDGPSGRFTRKLLDGLEERNAKATFLLCGYRIAQYPELAERILREGHEIGLHGYSHKSMQNMCQKDVAQEIQKVMALLPEDCQVSFLRSPGGACGTCVRAAAQAQGLSILHWSVDPKDWAVHDAQAVEKAVIRQVRDGDVILLHDMSDSSVEAALAIVDALQAQGFRFVTASELAEARNVTLVPGEKYARFGKTDPENVK